MAEQSLSLHLALRSDACAGLPQPVRGATSASVGAPDCVKGSLFEAATGCDRGTCHVISEGAAVLGFSGVGPLPPCVCRRWRDPASSLERKGAF